MAKKKYTPEECVEKSFIHYLPIVIVWHFDLWCSFSNSE